jgi:hypothetical protein
LTAGPKKDEGWKDKGYYVFSSTLANDGLGSGLPLMLLTLFTLMGPLHHRDSASSSGLKGENKRDWKVTVQYTGTVVIKTATTFLTLCEWKNQ